MIKESVHQEGKTAISIYAPNIGAPQYSKQILSDPKGEIDNTIIVGGTSIIVGDSQQL